MLLPETLQRVLFKGNGVSCTSMESVSGVSEPFNPYTTRTPPPESVGRLDFTMILTTLLAAAAEVDSWA